MRRARRRGPGAGLSRIYAAGDGELVEEVLAVDAHLEPVLVHEVDGCVPDREAFDQERRGCAGNRVEEPRVRRASIVAVQVPPHIPTIHDWRGRMDITERQGGAVLR